MNTGTRYYDKPRIPEIGYDYIGRSVVFWYNEGQGIEDPFRVIKIVRRDASNEQLIEQIISEIGSNPGSMPEGIGRIHDAGGARAIGGADNGVDAVASWKDKGDDRTDVPSYGKDGVLSEQVGNNKIVHSMPVGWNGLIFKEKFRKSDFKFKSQATQDEVAEHRALYDAYKAGDKTAYDKALQLLRK